MVERRTDVTEILVPLASVQAQDEAAVQDSNCVEMTKDCPKLADVNSAFDVIPGSSSEEQDHPESIEVNEVWEEKEGSIVQSTVVFTPSQPYRIHTHSHQKDPTIERDSSSSTTPTDQPSILDLLSEENVNKGMKRCFMCGSPPPSTQSHEFRRHLFHMHETSGIRPSDILRSMSGLQEKYRSRSNVGDVSAGGARNHRRSPLRTTNSSSASVPSLFAAVTFDCATNTDDGFFFAPSTSVLPSIDAHPTQQNIDQQILRDRDVLSLQKSKRGWTIDQTHSLIGSFRSQVTPPRNITQYHDIRTRSRPPHPFRVPPRPKNLDKLQFGVLDSGFFSPSFDSCHNTKPAEVTARRKTTSFHLEHNHKNTISQTIFPGEPPQTDNSLPKIVTPSASWSEHDHLTKNRENCSNSGLSLSKSRTGDDWDGITCKQTWSYSGMETKDDRSDPTKDPYLPFTILGTSADDYACHPHVLSPPIMEGLQSFMPESVADCNFFLKFSLVRDGPGLNSMLHRIRGCERTVLAIETTDGIVFGSFTSMPWRTQWGYYGNKESFVWRMRRSRQTECRSVVEQAMLESELEVFPYTGANHSIQLCQDDCLVLGSGEIHPPRRSSTRVCQQKKVNVAKKRVSETEITTSAWKVREEERTWFEADQADKMHTLQHFGHAIFLDSQFHTGSTSSSETFGNPCLTNRRCRGETFKIANLEVWTMTPFQNVNDAEHDETQRLSEEETNNSNLNLLSILMGTP